MKSTANLLALAGASYFAGYLTISRAARPADMTPAIAIGGAAALAGLVAGDLLLLALLGMVILPVSLTLITRATHYLPAPEVNLIALLETLLGPLWVWLALGERPSARGPGGRDPRRRRRDDPLRTRSASRRDRDAAAGVVV